MKTKNMVTILVLVEYSLQFSQKEYNEFEEKGHNPCFSRILFAIIYRTCKELQVTKSQSLF